MTSFVDHIGIDGLVPAELIRKGDVHTSELIDEATNKFGRERKLTSQQKPEATERCDLDKDTLRSIARSDNVSATTISRLAP